MSLPTISTATCSGVADEHRSLVGPLGDAERGDQRIGRYEEPRLEIAESERDAERSLRDAPAERRRLRSSALIKSIRGSDPDAAIYWLARMLEAGEEVRFLVAPAGDPGQRGRGQCRPAGPAAGGGRDASLRVRRAAGVPVDAGPGRRLSGLRAEIECGDGGDWRSSRHDVREGRLVPVPAHLRDQSLPRRQAARPRARLSSMRTTVPRALPRRTIWASSASITGRSIEASSKNWRERLAKIRACCAGQAVDRRKKQKEPQRHRDTERTGKRKREIKRTSAPARA